MGQNGLINILSGLRTYMSLMQERFFECTTYWLEKRGFITLIFGLPISGLRNNIAS